MCNQMLINQLTSRAGTAVTLFLSAFLLFGCSSRYIGEGASPPKPAPSADPKDAVTAVFSDDIDPLIGQYLVLDEVTTNVDGLIDLVISSFQKELDLVPESFWTEFEEDIDPSEMYRSAADLVAQQYTTNELQVIVTFLSSDVGKKFIEGQRELDRKQTHRGAAWVRKLREEITYELRLKGYL